MIRVFEAEKQIYLYDTETQEEIPVITVKRSYSHEQMLQEGYTAFSWLGQILYTKEDLTGFNVSKPSPQEISEQDNNPFAHLGFSIKTSSNYGWVEPYCGFVKDRADKYLLRSVAVEKFKLASAGTNHPVYLLQGEAILMDNLVREEG